MTKVGQLFEDEKIRAVKEATEIAEILSMTEEEVLKIQEKLSMPV